MADKKVGGVYIEIQARMGKLLSDLRNVQDGLEKTNDKGNALSATFKKVAGGIAFSAMLYKVVGALKESVKYASDLQETQNKFDVVFKNSKDKAEQYAKTLIEAYGMARQEAMAFLSGTGDILTGMGMQADAALELSNATAQLGTDLASFSNVEGGAARAIQAITSAMTGEREALKAYGIVVSEEMVMQELRTKGKDKLTGMSLVQAKAEATLAIAYSQSANAIGDMARSYDSYANIQRRVNSRMNDMQSSIGQDLLPSLSNLGLAFLSASKDGGILSNALHTVTKFIGETINSIALLIAQLDQSSAAGRVEDAVEKSKQLTEEYRKQEQLIYESWGSKEQFNKAVEYGNYIAKQQKKDLEDQKKIIIEQAQEIKNAHSEEKDKFATVQQLRERIANSDKVLAAEQENIAKREKQRTEEKIKDEEKITKEKKDQLEQQKKDIEMYGSLEQAAFVRKLQAFKEKWNEYMGVAYRLASQFSEVANMYASNQTARIEQETDKRIEAANAEYENQLAIIEASAASDSQKAEQKKALDEQLARDTKAIQDKSEKDKRKAQREAAKISKQLAIFDTLITTPQAAIDSYTALAKIPIVGPGLGAAAAVAATALGMAKLKLIQDQPLPALAEGGIIPAMPGGVQFVAGEAGSNEAVIPLNEATLSKLGQAIASKIGSGQTTNIYLDSELIYSSMYEDSRRGKVRIDSRAIV